MNLLADLIFPAPAAYYQATMALPALIAVLLFVEALVYRRMIHPKATWWKLLLIVTVINALSWVTGLMTSRFLPSGYEMTLVEGYFRPMHGPWFAWLVWGGIAWAWLVSVLVEFGAWRVLFHRLSATPPLRVVALANVASYVLFIAAAFMLRF